MLCPSNFEGSNSTLVQVFLCLIIFWRNWTSCLVEGIKNLHNSTEKNKKNMKGWDYSQPREHEYLQTGSTARK